MPPKPKNKLFPSVRVSEELYKITTELADQNNEYLSGYIRKAVEQRNLQHRFKINPNDWKFITGHVEEDKANQRTGFTPIMKEFRSFTGATVEEAILSKEGPENWYEGLQSYYNTTEGRKLEKRAQSKYLKTSGGKLVVRNINLKRKYGITTDVYTKLFESQHGKCAICNKDPFPKLLCVDHNHNTGKVRGLLCNNCNIALGMLKDSPELIDNAKAYLKLHETL